MPKRKDPLIEILNKIYDQIHTVQHKNEKMGCELREISVTKLEGQVPV